MNIYISYNGLNSKYVIISVCVHACMCVLTVLSRDDDDGDQQGGAQHDQAEGGEAVRLGDSQWAKWSESGTNWEET